MSEVAISRIARAFARVGWTGLGLQALLVIPPLFMLGYVLFGKVAGAQESLDLTDYLAFVGLMILAFTALWSFYYTRIARQLEDPARRPRWETILRILWIGLWAACLGIVISLVTLFIEVVRLLILFLKAPQAGVPVIRTELNSRTEWVSAIDAASLLAEVCTLAGEFLLLGLTLWLLFRITRGDDFKTALERCPPAERPTAMGLEGAGAAP